MKNDRWKIEYFDYLHDAKEFDVNRLKRDNMPSRLFRYEKAEKNRFETLRNNQFHISKTINFDDPYDAKGYYWKRNELEKVFDPKQINEIESYIKEWFENCLVGCFTEDLNNFPMWYYYADNYRGFCVEYDFSQLPQESEFQKALNPVLYMKEKLDLTNKLKTIFNRKNLCGENTYGFYWLHYIGYLIKHESWDFEKEWRYIALNENNEESKNISLPVKPSYIYCGKDMCEEDYNELCKIAEELECGCSKIKIGDNSVKKFVALS